MLAQHSLFSKASTPCSDWARLLKPACQRVRQIWQDGHNELYLTGYAWHNRYTYTPAKLATYNEWAWGGGLGKSIYDEHGDWHGLYAFAFLDSHKNIEPIAGYAFLKIARFGENTRLGAGVSVFLTARPDIYHNIPFPGVLPWASFNYKKATLAITYIPGAGGAGNVLFFVTRWLL